MLLKIKHLFSFLILKKEMNRTRDVLSTSPAGWNRRGCRTSKKSNYRVFPVIYDSVHMIIPIDLHFIAIFAMSGGLYFKSCRQWIIFAKVDLKGQPFYLQRSKTCRLLCIYLSRAYAFVYIFINDYLENTLRSLRFLNALQYFNHIACFHVYACVHAFVFYIWLIIQDKI